MEAVCASAGHRFSKTPCEFVTLAAGIGIVGDCHSGVNVQHLSRKRVDPAQPNLRQVHLLSAELLDELAGYGFALAPGDLGENVLTSGLDLLGLPRGTLLQVGTGAQLRVSGLRNPCKQIEHFRPGLLVKVVGRDGEGRLTRKCGIMATVEQGGTMRAGDALTVILPPQPHIALEVV